MEKIFVKLLDEGTNVYRPVNAEKLAENIYMILNNNAYDRDSERWEFEPGASVKTEGMILEGELSIVAKSKIATNKKGPLFLIPKFLKL